MTFLTARIVIIMKDDIQINHKSADCDNNESGRFVSMAEMFNLSESSLIRNGQTFVMKTISIFQLPGAIANLQDNTPIYIYGTAIYSAQPWI